MIPRKDNDKQKGGPMRTRPVVVVLAAGRGSRFNGSEHKLGQAFGDASVLRTTLQHVVASGLEYVVVITDALMADACRVVDAKHLVVLPSVGSDDSMPLGMGYSIAAGVSARPDATGWIVLPADMPLVEAATIRAVAEAMDEHPVAYASYRGRRGHPVGFDAELYSELSLLAGDTGANRLVARYPSCAVEAGDPGVLVDIDTEADLERARASWRPSRVATSGDA